MRLTTDHGLFRRLAIVAVFGFAANVHCLAESWRLESPSARLAVEVSDAKDGVVYSLDLLDSEIIEPSRIALTLADEDAAGVQEVVSVERNADVSSYRPVVPRKRNHAEAAYEELLLRFANSRALRVRLYDEGLAYRWELEGHDDSTAIVESEAVSFRLAGTATAWFSREESVLTGQEPVYERLDIDRVSGSDLASPPLLLEMDQGVKVWLSEADVYDYPGMFFRGSDDSHRQIDSVIAKYPLKIENLDDRHCRIDKHADYIAKTSGSRTLPWRIAIVSDDDRQLLETELVELLSRECAIAETSWIRPGKVAWDWWNDLNIVGVDFRAGVNTATYKHYIDFAAENQLEYVILDEGWSDTTDLLAVSEGVDVQEIVAYGKERNVGVILWVIWRTLDEQMQEALDAFESWGVSGVKVDFMDRDDQAMVNFYWDAARESAKRKLLVNFHGAYKPTGLRRAYPNVITREAVRGLEYTKWSDTITPEHNLTIPFTRMVAGPLDYTPGAMRNATAERFNDVFSRPVSQGTRCHQLAMYVVYESPLQMLCDSPSNYRSEPECMRFLSEVPTVWDDTVALEGAVSDYVAIARRSGPRWYVGVMTDSSPREKIIDLSFLPAGNWKASCWEDGINADRHAEDFRVREMIVHSGGQLPITLAPGGGWAAVLEPVADIAKESSGKKAEDLDVGLRRPASLK